MDDTMTIAGNDGYLRTRYYARQLVTPADLNLADEYFMERLRRHNRLLHGWGVICGALVCRATDADGNALPWKVRVTPGHAIDPYGNELVIPVEREVDLRGSVQATVEDPESELSDPWCGDVVLPDLEGGRVFVAIRYKQVLARPVRVQPAGCDCDDTRCEYSRWCDGYEVRMLDHCPDNHLGTPPNFQNFLAPSGIPSCPPPAPPDQPWVALAAVDVESGGTVTVIDNCGCRRMILSLAEFWWRCQSPQLVVSKVTADPPGPHAPGQSGIKLTVEGANIDENARADLGEGVRVTSAKVENGKLVLAVKVLKSARTGDRTLTVTNPDCTIARSAEALTVEKPPSPSPPPKRRRRP